MTWPVSTSPTEFLHLGALLKRDSFRSRPLVQVSRKGLALGTTAACTITRRLVPSTSLIIASFWLAGTSLIGMVALTSSRQAKALPAFAQQTGLACKSCHVGGFGPELTPFGREFKLGGYTMRSNRSNPIAAMIIASFTHTRKDQVPAPEHLKSNDNFAVDQTSVFVAGGLGKHLGGFGQLTYDGVGQAFSWDNMDLRAVTTGKVFGNDATFGLSLNNNPTVQDPWNTLSAWSFPYTDTAVSATPGAAPLIDGALAQTVLGLTAYSWIGHKLYFELGGYSSPRRATISWLGGDPFSPGSIHGIAPYGRIALQTQLAGGTAEIGVSGLGASIFPGRNRSSAFTDRYIDLGLDASWQRTFGDDTISTNVRFVHERGNLRASCALGVIGDGADPGCARYSLNETRATVRYNWHDKVGLTISGFSIAGSRNSNLYQGSELPDSNGVNGQLDYTFWPTGNSPLGRRFNIRTGAQYTHYSKFNGARHNFNGSGSNATDNNAIRAFTWIAF